MLAPPRTTTDAEVATNELPLRACEIPLPIQINIRFSVSHANVHMIRKTNNGDKLLDFLVIVLLNDCPLRSFSISISSDRSIRCSSSALSKPSMSVICNSKLIFSIRSIPLPNLLYASGKYVMQKPSNSLSEQSSLSSRCLKILLLELEDGFEKFSFMALFQRWQ